MTSRIPMPSIMTMLKMALSEAAEFHDFFWFNSDAIDIGEKAEMLSLTVMHDL